MVALDPRDDRGMARRNGTRTRKPSGDPSAQRVKHHLIPGRGAERPEQQDGQRIELARGDEYRGADEHDLSFDDGRKEDGSVGKRPGKTHVPTASRTTLAIRSM